MELIKINTSKGGKKTISARELHEFLAVKNHFTQWFDDNKSFFDEGIDYQSYKLRVNGGHTYTEKTDYEITLEMGKELAMMSRVEKGKEVRRYFIECEQRLMYGHQSYLIIDPIERAKAWILEQEEKKKLIEEKLLLELSVGELQPKADYYDTVTQSEHEVSIGEASKILNLGYGSITLFKKLRLAGVLMHDNIPYQNYVTNGWFRVVQNRYPKKDGTWGISPKTVVYQKGLDGIRKLLSK